jgi:hypothetical protein
MSNSTNGSRRSDLGFIADQLDLYAPPILILIGVTCNSLVIVIMRTRYFSNVSTSLYMCFNAIVDNITLLVAFPLHWLHVSFPELIYRGDYEDYICKVTYFIGVSTSNVGIVLTAAMTLERAVAIKFPLKAPSLCTKRKAKYVMLGLVMFVALKDIHYLLKSKMVPKDFLAYLCEIDITNNILRVYVNRVWPISQNIFLFLSFFVIIFSNLIITKSVRDADKVAINLQSEDLNGRNIRATSNGLHRKSSKSRQLTVMLILDSVTIMVCTLPLALYDIIRPDFVDADVGHIVFCVIFYLVYVNRCANFFLYCITGSRFRQALRSICCGRRFGRKDSIYYIHQTRESMYH